VARVSVLIKSYNHAQFVAQTIQSVLDQSFQDFEIVVTDDGSTDGTPDVIRSFADPRISLDVLPSNRGISAAMNATLARARGELVAILNSDDYALPDRLEWQVAFFDAHPDMGAVFTMPKVVDESGAPTASFFDFRTALALPDFSRRSCRSANSNGVPGNWARTVRGLLGSRSWRLTTPLRALSAAWRRR
jgi:glycosyltransferase involved in cell wall biosynthesis